MTKKIHKKRQLDIFREKIDFLGELRDKIEEIQSDADNISNTIGHYDDFDKIELKKIGKVDEEIKEDVEGLMKEIGDIPYVDETTNDLVCLIEEKIEELEEKIGELEQQ